MLAVFKYQVGLIFSLLLTTLVLTVDVPWERPESFHLMPAEVFGKKFLVGSVHHDFVLKEEAGCLEVVDRALRNTSRKCVGVDIGMNDGFYTQMFAAYGCHVYAFELQESCIMISRNATRHNAFEDLVNIFRSPVTNKHNDVFKIPHGDDNDLQRCDGGFSITGSNPNMKAHKPFNVRGHHLLHTVKLDSFFPENTIIDILKIDVEGHDPEVLGGAEKIFEEKRVRRAVIEVSKDNWANMFEDSMQIYKKIMGYGYQVFCVTERRGNIDWNVVKRNMNYEEFRAIVASNNCINWEFYLE